MEEIPKSAVDFCDCHDLPLMRVPWKIHLAEIIRVFCFCITKEDQLMFQTSSAFKNALFFPEEEKLYIVPQMGLYQLLISDLLQADLSSLQCRLQLMVAFMMEDML